LFQTADRAREADTVELSAAEASRGEDFSISIRLDSRQDRPPVRTLEGTVCFPGDVLEFVSIILGPAGERAGGRLTHTLVESEDCSKLLLGLEVKERIPEGVVVTLRFKVRDGAPSDQTSELRSDFRLTTAEGTISTKGVGGSVKILDPLPPVAACFLYMH
jgi:hypothetical protein